MTILLEYHIKFRIEFVFEISTFLGAFDPVKDSHNDKTVNDKKKSQEFALKRFYEVTEAHGERLVSGSDDFTLFLWNPEKDKKPLARLTGNVTYSLSREHYY